MYFKDLFESTCHRWNGNGKEAEAIDLHSKCRYGAHKFMNLFCTRISCEFLTSIGLSVSAHHRLDIFGIFAGPKLDPKSNFKFITRNIHFEANFSIRWISKAHTHVWTVDAQHARLRTHAACRRWNWRFNKMPKFIQLFLFFGTNIITFVHHLRCPNSNKWHNGKMEVSI